MIDDFLEVRTYGNLSAISIIFDLFERKYNSTLTFLSLR